MSLSTLLEAAKFLEMQEQQEQQQRAAAAEPPPKNNQTVVSAIAAAPKQTATAQLSTVLITSPDLLTLAQETAKKQAVEQQQPVVSSSTQQQPRQQRVLHNSFDIMNPLVIDEASDVKRKQPPMVFRAGTREVHNKLEKHRRAHLKECFDVLKKQLPQSQDEKKTSNLSILHSALRCIQSLQKL